MSKELWIDTDFTMVFKSEEEAKANCCVYMRITSYSEYEELAKAHDLKDKWLTQTLRELQDKCASYNEMMEKHTNVNYALVEENEKLSKRLEDAENFISKLMLDLALANKKKERLSDVEFVFKEGGDE